jgi:hypothetical protein
LYFGRVDPLSALDFENLDDRRRKKLRIKATNCGDWPIDLSHLREIKILGDGMFGGVKSMEDEDGEQYAILYFKGTWVQLKERR